MLAVTDAVVLSTLVDGVVLVVPTNEVSRGDVQRAIKTLDAVDARVLGTVLNRSSDVARQNYYYGYHARPADVKPGVATPRSQRSRLEVFRRIADDLSDGGRARERGMPNRRPDITTPR